MSARFYTNSPLLPGPVTLDGAEARHLASVCRLRPGDAVCLFNGDGHEYPATIQDVSRSQVTLEIRGVVAANRECPGVIEIAAPLPKGDRAQFLIEKLTELGVTSFVPLSTRRTVVDPSHAKLEKLGRWVIEASKQCGRNALMRIERPIAWPEYATHGDVGDARWLLHPGGERMPMMPESPRRFRAVVGPEGGFTDEETQLGLRNGWQLIDLGPRLLRVETAALVVAARLTHLMPSIHWLT